MFLYFAIEYGNFFLEIKNWSKLCSISIVDCLEITRGVGTIGPIDSFYLENWFFFFLSTVPLCEINDFSPLAFQGCLWEVLFV